MPIMRVELGPAEEYFISFDTQINPPHIEAVRVRIDNVTLRDMNLGLRLDLCDHPLYEDLKRYVRANP